MNGITTKVALVTAASRGIGRAIAVRLAAEGAAVAVNYVANDAAAKDVVGSITDAGGRAVAFQADMGVPDDVRALYARVLEEFGALDIVVNNHAHIVFGPLAEIEEADFDRTFAVTAKGTFVSLQEAARRISDGGRIINISAGGTAAAGPWGSAYHGAKAAVEQFTTTLSKELGPRGVTVNAVLPGVTRTDGLVLPPEMLAQLVGQTTLGRLGEPEDVADVVAFLASHEGRWMTGQLLRAGGGLM
jgi:3-oxoacyl-[acyl-carrier protein] reductase